MNNTKENKMSSKVSYIPEVGDYVKPDGWNIGESLKEDDGFKDSMFPGCQFRLHSIGGELAVNIKITSRMYRVFHGSWGWLRVEIEFVGDGEESQFCGGWLKPRTHCRS